jgi:hypothetical protein
MGLDESWVTESFAVARALARAKEIAAQLDAADAKAKATGPMRRRKLGDERAEELSARGREIAAKIAQAEAEAEAAEPRAEEIAKPEEKVAKAQAALHIKRRKLGPSANPLPSALAKLLAKAERPITAELTAKPPKPVEAAPPKVAAVPASLLDRPMAKPTIPQLALPGVAGEIQDYYLGAAMQPSQIMSLAVGLMVPTVLVSGNVIGPSGPRGCALHQTLIVTAPTSGGKQWAIDVTKECVAKAGAKKLLGPNRFKSGAGLVRWVKDNKVSLCVQDEIGGLLKKLGNPKSNSCEVEISDRMREFWAQGPGSIYNSSVGAAKDDDMEAIEDARLSIFGFGVKEEFFGACENDDIVNGFLNRMAVLEEPELIRPRTNFASGDFPFALMTQLGKLHSIKPQRLDWTPGAKEVYEAELDRVYSETDERERKLWARTPEKIVRAASTFAAACFATVVERSHMEIAQTFFRLSDRAFQQGIEEAEKKRELTHAELRHEIARRIASDFGGAASASEIQRSFRHNTKHKGAIDDALQDMLNSEMLERQTVKTAGRSKEVYRLRS